MTAFPALEKRNYQDIRGSLISGDLLFASGEYMFSKLIQKASSSCWSHVALVMRLNEMDRVMVFESVEGKGVRTIPLADYVNNFEGSSRGYQGRLAIGRHQHFASLATPSSLRAMAQFAVDRFGLPYDNEELARITARIASSALGFKSGEIAPGKDYICSEYVYECYKQIGLDVPFDRRGFIAPADFVEDPNIELLWEVEVADQPVSSPITS